MGTAAATTAAAPALHHTAPSCPRHKYLVEVHGQPELVKALCGRHHVALHA